MTDANLHELHRRLGAMEGTLNALPQTIAAAVAEPIERSSEKMCNKFAETITSCRETHDRRIEAVENGEKKLEEAVEDVKQEHEKTRKLLTAVGIAVVFVVTGPDALPHVVALVKNLGGG